MTKIFTNHDKSRYKLTKFIFGEFKSFITNWQSFVFK